MADPFSYFTPENMKDKKLSDLKDDPTFINDAVIFLKSERKGYTSDDLKKMNADDVVSEVLEHFRYQTTNEISMAKDLGFMNDKTVEPKQREAFGRLMFAFDNAKGEGLFDRGAEKIVDYLGGTVTAPSTYISAVAGLGSAGTGAAAIQSTKAASLAALRTAGKQILKRSIIAGMADGAVAAGQAYGNERIRENIAPDIGTEYKLDKGTVALSGALGFGIGAATYGGTAYLQHKGAKALADTIDEGRVANADRVAKDAAKARALAASAAKDAKSNAKMEAATAKVLNAISPDLVKEGNLVKRYLLSKDLPDGVMGGFSQDTIQRLSAASYDLAERLKIDLSDPNVRITEKLAENITANKEIFMDVAQSYGLTPRQLSAAYASEVSEAAKILATQSAISKKARRAQLEALSKKVDDLFAEGMAPAKAEDLTAIAKATRDTTHSVLWKTFKDVENARRMFMTSQPATTMRNNIFSVAMTGIDIVDKLNESVLNTITKGRKSGAATFNGTLDNLKYLTRDNYVADALVTILQSQTPEKFQKVFFDAAVGEAHLVKDSVFAKAGAAVNTLNTLSDYVVKRAIISGSIDRQLKELGNETIGTSVMDMLKKGTTDMLPDDILGKALDDSLEFTFQRRFGGPGASGMSQFAADAIRFIHNSGATVAIPFPRFLASQAKFVSDYTGLTIIRRGIKDATTKEASKFMTGAMMFGGLYAIQKDNILKGLEWNEVEGQDKKVYDGQAAFGPMALHVYTANLVARISEGMPLKKTFDIAKDVQKILGATEFRPGGGLTDSIVKALEAGNVAPLLNQVGDYFGSYTYPAAVVKDFYGQLDPRSSYLPETRDASVSVVDFFGVDIPMSVFQRVTRHLPDFDSAKISGELERLGINVSADTLDNVLEFFNTSTRTYYQTQYAKDADGNNLRQDAIRFDIFGDGPIRMQDPIVKQVTGLVGRAPKNALQREMSRLQIDPFKIYNPYSEKNAAIELLTQQKLQGNLAAKAQTFMESANYRNSKDDTEKRLKLSAYIKGSVAIAREEAEDTLKGMSKMPEGKRDYVSYINGEMGALSDAEKDKADTAWAYYSGKYGYAGLTFDEALDQIDASDMTEEEKLVYDTNMKKLFIDLGKNYTKYLGSMKP